MITRRFMIASGLSFMGSGLIGSKRSWASHPSAHPADLASLASQIRGHVFGPQSDRYDALRKTSSFNPHTDARPAAIVRCLDEDDVAHTLEFARGENLEVAVRSGGHDVLGASTCNGGIVIDLAEMNGVRLQSSGTVATVGGGARSKAVDRMLQTQGVALALGCAPDVGVAGLTLGGGYGWLVGKHGAACDSLRSVRIVTADGRALTASAAENSELFWALHGGGGNFGVVTSLEFTAHPLCAVTAGIVAYPGARLAEFLRFYRDYMAHAPNELVVEVLVMTLERPVVFAVACWCGDAAAGARVLAPLRAFGPPLADGISVRPYFNTASPNAAIVLSKLGLEFAIRASNDFFASLACCRHRQNEPPTAAGSYWLGGSVDALTDGAIAAIVDRLAEAGHRTKFGLGHYLHGAVCEVDSGATPLIRPRGSLSYEFFTSWDPEVPAQPHMDWVDQSIAAMRPHSRSAYINYLSTDDANAVEASYGAYYGRLRGIKRTFDPSNIFHRNRNVRP
jgi:FAD/FMN-containing dehydrogenase